MEKANFGIVFKNTLRPWKLFSLSIGLSYLFWGAYNKLTPDWDYGISIIMGLLTYFLAPWCSRTIVNLEYKKILLAIFLYFFVVDFIYYIYWTLVDEMALIMRPANFLVSTCFFWLCGFIWLHNGTLKDLITGNIK